jgi:hypothetical protein
VRGQDSWEASRSTLFLGGANTKQGFFWVCTIWGGGGGHTYDRHVYVCDDSTDPMGLRPAWSPSTTWFNTLVNQTFQFCVRVFAKTRSCTRLKLTEFTPLLCGPALPDLQMHAGELHPDLVSLLRLAHSRGLRGHSVNSFHWKLKLAAQLWQHCHHILNSRRRFVDFCCFICRCTCMPASCTRTWCHCYAWHTPVA